ncbi:MAG TPA: hypothetical protein VHD83_23605 [Puia sp.]|nr:hypothetical protein [Puia sp.]
MKKLICNRTLFRDHPRPRTRGFYDIPGLMDQFGIGPSMVEKKEMIQAIFQARRVPLIYIQEIRKHLDIHRGDWRSLLDTLPASERTEVKDFDWHVEQVTARFEPLTFP